jgi:hypothetical protein
MCFLTDIVITVILRVLSTFLTYFPRKSNGSRWFPFDQRHGLQNDLALRLVYNL